MGRCATHGSILIIHMPERGFREWNHEAIECLLARLAAKGLRVVTLSELAAAACKVAPPSAPAVFARPANGGTGRRWALVGLTMTLGVAAWAATQHLF